MEGADATSGGSLPTPSSAFARVDLPEFDPITPAQEQLMKDFIANHRPNAANDPAQRRYVNFFDDNWRTIAYKFLVSRKWNVADAGKMYSETIDFRTKMRFHEKPIWPPAVSVRGYDLEDVRRELKEPLRPNAGVRAPNVVTVGGSSNNGSNSSSDGGSSTDFVTEWDRLQAAVRPFHRRGVHYWDKTGHPVFIETMVGKHKEYLSAFKNALAPGRSLAEAWEDYHWHQTEVTGAIIRYQNRRRAAEFGREITTATIVTDCADLRYGILFSDLRKYSDKAWSDESRVIPEGMHRIIVVNCPSFISFAWGLVRHMVPKRTQEKILFCSGGPEKTREVLTTYIDEDKLPKFLGGTCECPGGCI